MVKILIVPAAPRTNALQAQVHDKSGSVDPLLGCGWRIVISQSAGHVTLSHSAAGLARLELVVADFKGVRAG